ncbi:MAG: ribonuclease R, partial [Gammaproteobacteria bacterium]|nr:ribonuclease R [Gammaproteobacteria bacterium]
MQFQAVARRRQGGPRTGGARTRQSRRYSHPVPDASTILQTLEEFGVPVGFDDLADKLGVSGERALRALRRNLQKMAASGRLLINRKGEYCLPAKLGIVTGIVSAHADGFGFLVPDEGDTDIYLPFQEMRQLLNGDRVAVRVVGSSRGKPAGSVVEILERGKHTAVGHYRREHGVGYVVEAGRSPHSFVIPNHHRGDAKSGDLVKLEIIEYPSAHREAQGKIVKVLGDPTDPGMITDVAIEQFEIPVEFPAQVTKEADKFGDGVKAGDKQGREDLREYPLITIDGADARDFDDAVYAEPDGDGWRLIVAIADVSHYVRPETPLDQEATKRGTSVYFADRVVPMLPETLSNGLCSLKPKVDRLCMVCDMRVGSTGKVSKSRFYRGVMRSAERMTYEQVDEIHRGDVSARKKYSRIIPQINNLYGVFSALLGARRRRGALDLDLPEVQIIMGDDNHIDRIAPRRRNDAHRLIEECMIAANVEAGRFLGRERLASLYRVHDKPEEDRFEDLRLLLQEIGFKVPDEARTDPGKLNRLLEQIADRPDYAVLAVAVLRSLSQAVYQPHNIGHFGLGLNVYAHFTSPIRRYPDLLVHRSIGHRIDGGKPGAFRYDQAAMEQLGKTCSMLERRAEDATRQAEARYKCAYMLDHVGDVLPGVVTGVTHFGLFVTLDELFIDGLVHVTSLGNDYYHAEHGGLRLTGERTGRSYGLGDSVTVRVLRVDIDEAKLDFALVDDDDEPGSIDRSSAR